MNLIVVFYNEDLYEIYMLDVHEKSASFQRRNVCKLGIKALRKGTRF